MSRPSVPTGPAAAIRVLRKDLRESLRDRSLVLQLVLIPLFLYPLLGFGAWQVYLVSQGAAQKRPLQLMVDADLPASVRQALEAEDGLTLQTTPPDADRPDAPASADWFRSRREGSNAPDAQLSWWTPRGASNDSAAVFFDRARDRSQRARDLALEALEDHQREVIDASVAARGLAPSDLVPWRVASENLASSRDAGRHIVSLLLPIFLMIMLPQGIYYAALDAVVGERERGTWETILSSPLRRTDILAGKFLHVVFWGMVTFSLNLLSMLGFGYFVLQLVGVGDRLKLQLDPVGLLVAVLAALLLAVTLAAVMMVVAMPARTYREGQASLSPVYMVSAFAGMFVITSGEGLSWTQALIPIVNVTALLKSAFRGDLPVGPALLTFAVLGASAAICLVFASRLARSEGIFFDPELSLKKLLRMGGRGDE